jgi:phage tail-like protein
VTNLLEEQLPVIMAEDPNLVRFVRLVDPTASELYDRVGDKESIFHPATAPPPVVRWWCSVLGLPVHDDVQIEVRRAVVSAAAETYPIRGTERSLWMVLAAFSRAPVTIEETGVVFSTPEPRVPPRVAGDQPVGAPSLAPPTSVRIVVGATEATVADLRALIERELRADVPYELVVGAPEPPEGRVP